MEPGLRGKRVLVTAAKRIGEIGAAPCDVRKPADVAKLTKRLGRLDVLVSRQDSNLRPPGETATIAAIGPRGVISSATLRMWPRNRRIRLRPAPHPAIPPPASSAPHPFQCLTPRATNRVHRIGQRRGVQVFKLVTKGTLEEKIDKMIAAKGELMNSVVDVETATFKRFDREELIELLTGAKVDQSALAPV